MPMNETHPLHPGFERARRAVGVASVTRRYRDLILAELDAIEEWIMVHDVPAQVQRVISLGLPITINREGKIMAYELASNLVALFPLRVNGAAPPAGDTFTVVSNNADQFTAEIDVMPPEADADAGSPAVKVTPLTLNGLAGCSFTVSDSAGDTAATETFDIVAPAAPPPPAGTISVDEAGIATSTNPSPPTA